MILRPLKPEFKSEDLELSHEQNGLVKKYKNQVNDAMKLSDRSISVALDGQRPSMKHSNARVLKGSILGLTFCFLYN